MVSFIPTINSREEWYYFFVFCLGGTAQSERCIPGGKLVSLYRCIIEIIKVQNIIVYIKNPIKVKK